MMKMNLPAAAPLALLAAGAALSSCVKLPESRPMAPTYYHLEAMEGLPAGGDDDLLEGGWFHVQRVELAPYLDDSRLVARRNPNEAEFFDQHRWSEDLEDSLARVLGKNLSVLFGTLNYSTHPHVKRATHDFEIGLAVERFEWIDGDQVILSGSWRLFREGKQIHVAPLQETVALAAASGEDQSGKNGKRPPKLIPQVKALGQAMRNASERIAAQIIRTLAENEE